MDNTSKGVLFLPPSDAYVRSFLYLLYTLIKLYYTKFWAIKPRLWPRTEIFSSRGQESQRLFLCQQQPFNIMYRRIAAQSSPAGPLPTKVCAAQTPQAGWSPRHWWGISSLQNSVLLTIKWRREYQNTLKEWITQKPLYVCACTFVKEKIDFHMNYK